MIPGNDVPKVLIVDDKSENLYAFENVLRDMTCQIFKARSGQEALRLAWKHEFALMLLDVQMPEMDGFEVAALMKGNPKTKDIPIVFISANNKERSFIKHGYQVGAVDYLLKPVKPEVLRRNVKMRLDLYEKRKARQQRSSRVPGNTVR